MAIYNIYIYIMSIAILLLMMIVTSDSHGDDDGKHHGLMTGHVCPTCFSNMFLPQSVKPPEPLVEACQCEVQISE